MTTTDCANCGRKGGTVTINWKNQFVDAQGVTWWEQKNGDSWCGPCVSEEQTKPVPAQEPETPQRAVEVSMPEPEGLAVPLKSQSVPVSPIEDKQSMKVKAAAAVLGRKGGKRPKGYSAEEIEKRQARMRDVANAYHAGQRAAKVALIMAEREAAKAVPVERLEWPVEVLVESVTPEGALVAENATVEG